MNHSDHKVSVQHVKQLGRSRRQAIVEEFLVNSVHFPSANLLYEFFLSHGVKTFTILETYALIVGAIVQAIVLGNWCFDGKKYLLLGNLIGPAVYLSFEFLLEGFETFSSPNHQAYLLFAVSIGLVQQLQVSVAGLHKPLLVLEAVIRTSIITMMYILFEMEHADSTFLHFFDDEVHQFMAAAIVFLGVLLGIANLIAKRLYDLLVVTARRLKEISEWSWGEALVSDAVSNPEVLKRKRVERLILFLDIRGFTAWSEKKTPEDVVAMLNETFSRLEDVWSRYPVVRAKHTGDELMLVVDAHTDGVALARQLGQAADDVLEPRGLGVGIGLHYGIVIEGLMGSQSIQAYDVLGDNVNLAARLCSSAKTGECVFSQAVNEKYTVPAEARSEKLTVKGKSEPLLVKIL